MAGRGENLLKKWAVTITVTVLVTVTAVHTATSAPVEYTHTVHELSQVTLGAKRLRGIRIRGPQIDVTLDLERNEKLPVPANIIGDDAKVRSTGSFDDRENPVGPYYYQNIERQTALEIQRTNTGHLILQGTVGAYVIKPANNPEDMNRLNPSEHQEIHHTVIKRSVDYDDFLGKFKRGQTDNCYITELYPEILLLLDQGLYEVHGHDENRATSFAHSFLNEMDTILKSIACPKIRIHVTNVGYAKHKEQSYIEENKIRPGNERIDIHEAIYDFARWLYKANSALPTFDLVMQLTNKELCVTQEQGEPVCGVYGMSFPEGLCKINSGRRQINSATIVREPGGYSGVLTAIHELLHLMSATHDDNIYETNTSGCPSSDGYLMAKGDKSNLNQFKLSSCTIDQIRNFTQKDGSKCLRNTPDENFELLPQHRYSLTADQQCRMLSGYSSCPDLFTCTDLFCYMPNIGGCIAYEPPMERTACDNGRGSCRLGTCVHHVSEDNGIFFG